MAEDSRQIQFDKDFCEQLEFRLTNALRNSNDSLISGLWCDGVLVPAPEWLSKKRINDKRQLETVSWIGLDGQGRFETIIHFGKYSLRRCASGAGLTDTIPSDESSDWIEVDVEKQKLAIYLL